MVIKSRRKYNKFNSIKTVVDGIKFMSKSEARRYSDLKLLELSGNIKELKLQPKFELQPKFSKNGVKYKPIYYIADFSYYDIDSKSLIIEDVKSKSTKTPVYLVKKKMFEYRYPELSLKEVFY